MKEGPTSPHRPVAPVAHLVSRSIRRANAPPLGVNIFYGALGGFLEEHGSDVVLASSFKGAFRTANAPTSFCSAAQTCGVDVATLEYKDFVSADYNLHMLEPEQHCGALWLVELKQSTPLSPFKPKDLVECYDMLKLHAREIIQEDTLTLTMPLIGKGAKANHFQIGRNEVIVELVGFLHWIAENMSDRPNLAAINIVSSNNFTAHALQSAFDLLIPVQLDKLEDIIKQAMARSAQALAQFEGELKKLEQADKAEREEERRLAREQNGSAPSAESERPDWERRATQREKRETRKKLDDIVTKLRIVHKSVANILAAVQAFKAVREVSIIIVACAVNGRIVAELCSELFLLDDDLLRQQQPQPGGRGAGGRGRGFGAPYADAGRGRGRGFAGQPGAGAGSAQSLAPPPAMAPDQNLFGRMTQLKASGKIEKELYHHFQTLRLIGNKAVHSTVLKATTVDLGAIVLAVHGLITCPHFS